MAHAGVPFNELGPPWNRQVLDVPAPPEIAQAPAVALYGIAYDLYQHDIEDPLPFGWAKYRSSVYRQIQIYLTRSGFVRQQYSVWHRHCTSINAWNVILGLREIAPRGIFATVVRCLELFSVPIPQQFIMTDDIRLDGIYSVDLLGPTPAFLAAGLGGGGVRGVGPLALATGCRLECERIF